MSTDSQPTSLLDQLDKMQDDVIRELDALDDRIMALIKKNTAGHDLRLSVVAEDEEFPEAA